MSIYQPTYAQQYEEEMWDGVAASDPGFRGFDTPDKRDCPRCGQPISDGTREGPCVDCQSVRESTEPQRNYIRSLLQQKELSDEQRTFHLNSLDEFMAFSYASTLIDTLKAQPDKERVASVQAEPSEDFPRGYYAVTGLEGFKNETNFFKLNPGKPGGRWEGYLFVDQYVAGHGYFPVKGRKKDAVLAAIKAQGINEARMLYGQEIGKCGVCGHTLTDDTSRALGIGPHCREGF